MKQECINKKIGNLLFFYEMELLSDEESEKFEEHILECDYCFEMLSNSEKVFDMIKENPKTFSNLTELQPIHFWERTLKSRTFKFAIAAVFVFCVSYFAFEYNDIWEPQENEGNQNFTTIQSDSVITNQSYSEANNQVKKESTIQNNSASKNQINSKSNNQRAVNTQTQARNQINYATEINTYKSEIEIFANDIISSKSFDDQFIIDNEYLISAANNNQEVSNQLKQLKSGIDYLRNGKYSRTLEILNSIDSTIHEKYYYLGLTYFKSGYWKESIINLKHVTAHPQYRSKAQKLLFLAYLKLKDYSLAESIIQNNNLDENFLRNNSELLLKIQEIDSLKALNHR